jgi:hypothetical protein
VLILGVLLFVGDLLVVRPDGDSLATAAFARVVERSVYFLFSAWLEIVRNLVDSRWSSDST